MRAVFTHPLNISEEQAKKLQLQLSKKIVMQDDFKNIDLAVGVDVAYSEVNDILVAAAVVIDINTLQVIESKTIEDTVKFPYISGLFSFREAPAIVKVLQQLTYEPDLIICDGQGYAHPRRFGLACHIGLIFDKPTIGCAKTRYLGEYEEPEIIRGSYSDLIDNNEVIGSVLRTQNSVNPIFISIGHKVSVKSANRFILSLSPKYRLPETTRFSDQEVRKKLKKLC